MHIKFTYSHKLNIYNIYSKSYTKTHSKLASRREEAFGALALLRLLASLLLSSFSINITRRRCPSLPAEVLYQQKPNYFLTFQSKNERIHLVIILNN
jgi:hypothetical protein